MAASPPPGGQSLDSGGGPSDRRPAPAVIPYTREDKREQHVMRHDSRDIASSPVQRPFRRPSRPNDISRRDHRVGKDAWRDRRRQERPRRFSRDSRPFRASQDMKNEPKLDYRGDSRHDSRSEFRTEYEEARKYSRSETHNGSQPDGLRQDNFRSSSFRGDFRAESRRDNSRDNSPNPAHDEDESSLCMTVYDNNKMDDDRIRSGPRLDKRRVEEPEHRSKKFSRRPGDKFNSLFSTGVEKTLRPWDEPHKGRSNSIGSPDLENRRGDFSQETPKEKPSAQKFAGAPAGVPSKQSGERSLDAEAQTSVPVSPRSTGRSEKSHDSKLSVTDSAQTKHMGAGSVPQVVEAGENPVEADNTTNPIPRTAAEKAHKNELSEEPTMGSGAPGHDEILVNKLQPIGLSKLASTKALVPEASNLHSAGSVSAAEALDYRSPPRSPAQEGAIVNELLDPKADTLVLSPNVPSSILGERTSKALRKAATAKPVVDKPKGPLVPQELRDLSDLEAAVNEAEQIIKSGKHTFRTWDAKPTPAAVHLAIQKQVQDQQVEIANRREEYNVGLKAWKSLNDELDRVAEDTRIEKEHTEQEATQLHNRRRTREEEVNNHANQTPTATNPTGSQSGNTRRSRDRHSRAGHGDVARSEAEFLEILANLEAQTARDPLVRARLTSAKIPDQKQQPEKYVFASTNSMVVDKSRLLSRLKTDAYDTFSKDEHLRFVDAYVKFPKQFGRIAALVGRDFNECVMHYYRTKKQTDYKEILLSKTRRKRGRKPKRKVTDGMVLAVTDTVPETPNEEEMSVDHTDEFASFSRDEIGGYSMVQSPLDHALNTDLASDNASENILPPAINNEPINEVISGNFSEKVDTTAPIAESGSGTDSANNATVDLAPMQQSIEGPLERPVETPLDVNIHLVPAEAAPAEALTAEVPKTSHVVAPKNANLDNPSEKQGEIPIAAHEIAPISKPDTPSEAPAQPFEKSPIIERATAPLVKTPSELSLQKSEIDNAASTLEQDIPLDSTPSRVPKGTSSPQGPVNHSPNILKPPPIISTGLELANESVTSEKDELDAGSIPAPPSVIGQCSELIEDASKQIESTVSSKKVENMISAGTDAPSSAMANEFYSWSAMDLLQMKDLLAKHGLDFPKISSIMGKSTESVQGFYTTHPAEFATSLMMYHEQTRRFDGPPAGVFMPRQGYPVIMSIPGVTPASAGNESPYQETQEKSSHHAKQLTPESLNRSQPSESRNSETQDQLFSNHSEPRGDPHAVPSRPNSNHQAPYAQQPSNYPQYSEYIPYPQYAYGGPAQFAPQQYVQIPNVPGYVHVVSPNMIMAPQYPGQPDYRQPPSYPQPQTAYDQNHKYLPQNDESNRYRDFVVPLVSGIYASGGLPIGPILPHRPNSRHKQSDADELARLTSSSQWYAESNERGRV